MFESHHPDIIYARGLLEDSRPLILLGICSVSLEVIGQFAGHEGEVSIQDKPFHKAIIKLFVKQSVS